ncbi:hypothetical protein GBA65_00895 [Rubrobacter marinus]|uniref:DUF3616 domain-containing protein n=1 Tax=Rubrobacter marinus TaxID=2653852 RepID=A0A6G8PSF9_9ACTN|nr:DUF3616 domain-containing protein [Rubrobacter marinus]QIN77304.1 hypothetical protein GBA65_00895 [Rubrobacter marinus]
MSHAISNLDDLYQFMLDLSPNEASGLLAIENDDLLREHGWDRAFWVCLDEGPVTDCIALVGHRADSVDDDLALGWEIARLRAAAVGETKATEDAEGLARKDGYVYVIGSHFGSKRGPLHPKRGFVARFGEAGVLRAANDPPAEIEVARPSFVLHRVINDAFGEHGVRLIPLGPNCRRAFVDETIEVGEKKRKRWSGRVREDDYPLNIEGLAFRPNGSLLIGLRFPMSADGRPMMVEVEGIERLFEGGAEPEVKGFWTLDAVGRGGEIAGVRDLTFVGDELHAITGDVDSAKAGSLLLEDYPGGSGTISTHWRVTLPEGKSSGELKPTPVREFPGLPRVEGIAGTEDGRFFYVVDEDEGVLLRLTRLLVG